MMSATQQLPRWLSLQAHPQDNVAIVVNDGGAPPGATFQDGMTAIEHIPQGHKIALQALRKGTAVRRLGAVIGTAPTTSHAAPGSASSCWRCPPHRSWQHWI